MFFIRLGVVSHVFIRRGGSPPCLWLWGERRQHIWTPGVDLTNVTQKLQEMQYQVTALSLFGDTAKSLHDTATDELLPNQLVQRVKHIIKFTFEQISADHKEKQEHLLALNPDALTFLGLCYTVREIKEMSLTKFNFLQKHVAEFLDIRGISRYLHRKDLDSVILLGNFNPASIELLAEFQTCTIYISYFCHCILTFVSATVTTDETEAR
jgi:hypothetical protein